MNYYVVWDTIIGMNDYYLTTTYTHTLTHIILPFKHQIYRISFSIYGHSIILVPIGPDYDVTW